MENVIWAIVFLVVIALVFLILREVVCWYFKINERMVIAEDLNEAMEKLVKQFKELKKNGR